jgi:hypothetical protein
VLGSIKAAVTECVIGLLLSATNASFSINGWKTVVVIVLVRKSLHDSDID